jgi:hypothetical protein
VAGAGEGAGEEEDGEREEEGEQAGEGGAALGALEGLARDVDAEAVVRHDADHAGMRWNGLECEEPFFIFIFFFYFFDAKGHRMCGKYENVLCLEDMHEEYDADANDVLGDGWDVLNVAHENDVKVSMDVTNVDVAEFVERVQLAPVERPAEERTGDVYGLHDPFPADDMGLDGCDYSGSSFTGSEMTNDQDEDFYKDSKGLLPDQVFALASVPLEEKSGEAAGARYGWKTGARQLGRREQQPEQRGREQHREQRGREQRGREQRRGRCEAAAHRRQLVRLWNFVPFVVLFARLFLIKDETHDICFKRTKE